MTILGVGTVQYEFPKFEKQAELMSYGHNNVFKVSLSNVMCHFTLHCFRRCFRPLRNLSV